MCPKVNTMMLVFLEIGKTGVGEKDTSPKDRFAVD